MKFRKAVFIVTYSKIKNDFEFLILKRKLHWKGWEFPKGGVNFFETKKTAVKRELIEETGLSALRIKKFDFSGKYNYSKRLSDRPNFKGQTFSLYAVQVKKEKAKLDTVEHSDYKWVSYEKALKMLKWPNQKKSLEIVNNFLKEEMH